MAETGLRSLATGSAHATGHDHRAQSGFVVWHGIVQHSERQTSPTPIADLGFFLSVAIALTLTVIHQDAPDQYHVTENVQTPQGSRSQFCMSPSHRASVHLE